MTAMFPASGVPASDAKNSLPNPDTIYCDELWYSTARCQPRFDPAAANAMLAELVNLINKGEVVYDCSFLNQVELSVRYLIQRGLPRGVQLSGGPTVYTGVLDPKLTRYNNFLTLTVVPNVTSASGATVNFNELGPKPILRNDGTPLAADDLKANIPSVLAYYNNNFYNIGASVPSGIVPPHRFTDGTPGTRTFTAQITGWHKIWLAGGGGAGGSTAAGGTTVSGGGSGGGRAEDYVYLTKNGVYTYSVGGGGGVTSAPSDGGEGGNTVFNGPAGTVVAAGGHGGLGSANNGFGVGGGGGYGVSASGFVVVGGPGWSGIPQLSQGGQGGIGAGGGGGGQASTGSGNYGMQPGGGGSGAVGSLGPQPGGAGGAGLFTIEW